MALEREIEERTGFETRMTILGHVQRGGTPQRLRPRARHPLRHRGDRRGERGDFGKMVALRGTEIVTVPLAEALAEPKLLDPELFETAEVFFG